MKYFLFKSVGHSSLKLLIMLPFVFISSCGNKPTSRAVPLIPVVTPNAQNESPEEVKNKPNPNLTTLPVSPVDPTHPNDENSESLRLKIIKELSGESLLSNVVRMKLMGSKNGQMSHATAKNFLRPLLPQEKQIDFGPFTLDRSELQKNSKRLNLIDSDVSLKAREVQNLIDQCIHSLQTENSNVVNAEVLRLNQIKAVLSQI